MRAHAVLRRNPLFSVVIPTYNRPDMVRRSVASVLRQELDDFELIVVVDQWSPAYEAALAEFRDARIVVIKSTMRRGAAAARNLGVEAARGTYVSFLDDDDEYLSSFLLKSHHRLDRTGDEVGITWCGVEWVDDDVNSTSTMTVRSFAESYPSRQALFEAFLSVGTGFGITIKRKCWEAVGPFNCDLKAVEDADLFLRILDNDFVPAAVPGVHVVLHNHTSVRLTDRSMNAVRIDECHWLMAHHAGLMRRYPYLRAQIAKHVEFLKTQAGGPHEH